MKATDLLLADHRLLNKLLPQVSPDNPESLKVQKTLFRTIIGHAWFEDQIFIPSFRERGLLKKLFSDEIEQEHRDLETLIPLIHRLNADQKKEREAYLLQLTAILKAHLQKEEDALFPMAERILKEDGLLEVGKEMESHKTDIRERVKDYY